MTGIDKTTARLPAENFAAIIGDHEVNICVAYHPVTGAVHEVAFGERGKIGQGMDVILCDLAVALSRAIQRRDPMTGAPLS